MRTTVKIIIITTRSCTIRAIIVIIASVRMCTSVHIRITNCITHIMHIHIRLVLSSRMMRSLILSSSLIIRLIVSHIRSIILSIGLGLDIVLFYVLVAALGLVVCDVFVV